MTLATLYNFGLKPLINDNKIANFLEKVGHTYQQDV